MFCFYKNYNFIFTFQADILDYFKKKEIFLKTGKSFSVISDASPLSAS